jgi:tetratricopeptide (TPR) repeat protein
MNLSKIGLLTVVLMVLGPGCMTQEKTSHATAVAPPLKQVKVGGTATPLGEAQQPAITTDALILRMHDLLAENKPVTARHLVERYPDVALDVLRGAGATQAANPALQAIAKDYDQCCCQVEPKSGWAALCKDRAEHPEHYAAQDAARKQVVEHLHSGHAKEAIEVRLAATAKGTPGVTLELDALQLAGEALVQADRSKEAVAVLAQAHKLAGSAFPHQTVKILLLLSDAERRAGQDAKAAATWKEAAELAASILEPPHAIADPAMWERLAYMRPVNTPWPSIIALELNRRPKTLASLTVPPIIVQASVGATPNGRIEVNEAQVWAMIGQWRFVRSEPQGALLAFKQGQTFAHDQISRDRLELCAARSLAQMNQRAAAVAILARLTEKQDTELVQPAFAVLGSLLFNEGQTAQAQALLRKAMADGKDWPGRAEALADLGLACLTAHEETEGLNHLHEAQKCFEAEGQYELLQQSLWNEAKYFERIMKLEDAAAVRDRGRRLESN